MNSGKATFWEHLDELREAVLHCLAVTLVVTVVSFCFKERLFEVVLAPSQSDFIVYRWISAIGGGDAPFAVPLINTGLARQFVIHIRMALCAGVIATSPYLVYRIFRFVSPALYADERRYATRFVGWGYLLFAVGMSVGYFLIFPLTFRFLGTYQVAASVDNLISLDSYVSTLLTMCLAMGIVFEIPILCLLFARMGLLSADFMRRYRRHAVVIILVVAAVITPTSDVVTLTLVSLPMWLLYEASIRLIK